jgi:hypothetical protein
MNDNTLSDRDRKWLARYLVEQASMVARSHMIVGTREFEHPAFEREFKRVVRCAAALGGKSIAQVTRSALGGA